jgi:hypothetical protein
VLDMHPGQWKAWKSKSRFIFVVAGTQGGKTSWGPWWLWREIQACGGGDYLAVTSSYDLFKLKMLPVMRETFEGVLGIGRYWVGDRIMEICDPATGKFLANKATDPMWGRVILRSASAGGGLESSTAKAAWLDEAGQDDFTLETWEAVLRRLSINLGRALATTTIYNLGWIKTEIYDPWVEGKSKDTTIIQFPSYINPSFPRREYNRAKRSGMQNWRFGMFYEGKFTKPAGMIYDAYDSAVHLIDDFAIPDEWPRYVGLDYGGVNQSLVWLAKDITGLGPKGLGAYYLYRESLEGGMSTKQHAERCRGHYDYPMVAKLWGGSASEDQQRRDWKREGVTVLQPSVSDVEGGIDRVYSLFERQELFVFRSCKGTQKEIDTYKRKLDKRGEPTEEIEDKRKYHRLDALRYVASGLIPRLLQRPARSYRGIDYLPPLDGNDRNTRAGVGALSLGGTEEDAIRAHRIN